MCLQSRSPRRQDFKTKGVPLVEKVYQFIGLSVKVVRQGSKPWLPRLFRPLVFEEWSRKGVHRAYASHTVPLGHAPKVVVIQPTVLQANLHQALSSRHSIRICRTHELRTLGTAVMVYFKVQPVWFTGTEPTVQWARTYIWMAKNYLHLNLLLIQVALHHGRPQRQSANKEQLHLLLGRNQQRQGANEKGRC